MSKKTTAAEARKKTLEKLNKGKKHSVDIENTEFIGAPISVRSVYDYVEFQGQQIPVMSRFGTFMVEMKNDGGEVAIGPDGKPMKAPIDMWRRSHTEIFSSPLIRMQPPRTPGTILLHYPTYREHMRYAKLSVLYVKVRAGIAKRVKFTSAEDLDAVALWVIATHFARVFDHFPLLDFVKAGYNAGGSVALKTVLSYCPRPLILQSPTEASLFRLADDLRPSMGVEEYTTDLKEDVRRAIQQLLDGSFDKRVLVPRTEKFQVKVYDFFGPRAIVDPQGLLSQYSTASRALVIPLVNSPGFQSNADAAVAEDGEVIQTLYDSFLVYADKVRKAYEHCNITGSGRADQAFRPLLAIALVLKSEGVNVVDSLMAKVQRLAESLETVKTEGDITKQIFNEVRNFVASPQYSEKWLRTRQDGMTYIRLSQLRTVISNALGIEFQNDKGPQGTRYWSRPSKEVSEYIQDGKRFAAMFKTFLPEFVGQAEPGTRTVCLHFTDVGLLIERLNSLVGNTRESIESNNIQHVGFTVDPAYSYMINKKIKKIQQYTKYNRKYRGIEQETLRNTGSSEKNTTVKNEIRNKNSEKTSNVYFHFVGFDLFFNLATSDNAASTLNPTSRKHVGFEKNDVAEAQENTAPEVNPTSDSVQRNTNPEPHLDPPNSGVHDETSHDALRKLVFDIVESEAPRSEHHSLKPKVIYEMIGSRAPDATIADIFKTCEQLEAEGAFLPKNRAGAYRANQEYLNGDDP